MTPINRRDLLTWLIERYENCQVIAAEKSGSDKIGWLIDANYFDKAIAAVENPPDLKLLATILHVGENTPYAKLLEISERCVKQLEYYSGRAPHE
jgi:hypothetical protein